MLNLRKTNIMTMHDLSSRLTVLTNRGCLRSIPCNTITPNYCWAAESYLSKFREASSISVYLSLFCPSLNVGLLLTVQCLRNFKA